MKKLLVLISTTAIVLSTYGQVYNIKFETAGGLSGDYLQQGAAGSSVAAPAGTWLWYVQDTGNNGFFADGELTVTETQINQLFNRDNTGGFDDFILLDWYGSEMDAVSTGEGRTANSFTLGTTMPKEVDTYAMLWYNVNDNATIGDEGDQFGFLNLGTIAEAPLTPGFNEYQMTIGDYIYSGTVTVVPEPTAYAAVFGLGLIGVAVYRRFAKKTA